MYKIAVMGDYDSIYGFASLGLTTFPVEMDTPAEEAARILKGVVDGGYGVIYVTEALAAVIRKDIAAYAGNLTPAIIEIPGVRGNTGNGIAGVKKSVEQAVGSDILFGEN